MTKQQFTKLMNEFISLKKDAENLNTAFRKLEPDFNYISFGRYETLVLDALKVAMNDDSDWIGYWVYECDCGKRDMKVTDKGKKVPMKTISNLYDCIVNVG